MINNRASNILRASAILTLLLILTSTNIYASNIFDKQTILDNSPNKLNSLRSAVEEIKLLPTPNGINGDGSKFGTSVSVDGNLALVGGPGLVGTGGVYVMEYNGTWWGKTEFLTPSDGEAHNNFGHAVSLSGNRALIGTSDDFAGTTGTAAYIFDLQAGVWTQTQKLTVPGTLADENFGFSVSLSGDRALIGKPREDTDTDPFNGGAFGSAYIFDLVAGTWTMTAKLIASDREQYDFFGWSVALDGDTAMIGAKGNDAGSVYVYEFDGVNTWIEAINLTATDGVANDRFGSSISLENNKVVIGSPQHNSNKGAAYVFYNDFGTWLQEAKLYLAAGDTNDDFGASVSLSGINILIGVPGDDTNAGIVGAVYHFIEEDEVDHLWSAGSNLNISGLVGNSVAISGNNVVAGAPTTGGSLFPYIIGAGAVYTLEYNAPNWVHNGTIDAGPGAGGDFFGRRVSLSSDFALVGSHGENENGLDSGAAYLYKNNAGNWSQIEKIMPAGIEKDDYFGTAVNINDNYAFIAATGDDDLASNAGAVYVYEFAGGVWSFIQKLTADDGSSNDRFGNFISSSGNNVLIGAKDDADGGSSSGSAYIFNFSGGTWTQISKLTASDASAYDYFGTSLSLDGYRAAIGSWGSDSNKGAIYIYDFNGIDWAQSDKILASDGVMSDQFGRSISLHEDRLLVDSRNDNAGHVYVFEYSTTSNEWQQSARIFEDHPNIGIGRSSISQSGNRVAIGGYWPNEGATYIYEHSASGWSEVEIILASDGSIGDAFGNSTFMVDDKVIIGAGGNDDNGNASGSAYIYNLPVFTVSGNVSGLTGTDITIQNNLVDDIIINTDGSFTFSQNIYENTNYAVTVLTQPTNPNQTCVVTNGTGTITSANINNVSVVCTINQYSVGGTYTGIADGSFDIQNNNGDTLTINASNDDGIFTFPTNIDDQSDFSVTILSNPTSPNHTCSISGGNSGDNDGTGTIVSANYSGIIITCSINQYTIGGNVVGLATNNAVIIRDNLNETILVTTNSSFIFPTAQDDGSHYTVVVQQQPTTPTQTCSVLNGDNTLSGNNVNSIFIDCNTQPIINSDTYTINEDTNLIANDSNGTSTTTANDNSVIVNDSDLDSDVLNVVSPGSFTASGIGGDIVIASNGTFTYAPPQDLSGQATYVFDITDSVHTISSSITINVLPSNDAPSFNINGDIDASTLVSSSNQTLQITDFVNNIVLGPSDESGQNIQQIQTIIVSDSQNILNSASTTNLGTLDLDFTINEGVAILQVILIDNGGTTNNGVDTSAPIEFNVTYSNDLIFVNGFEVVTLKLFDYLELLKNSSAGELLPKYDFESDSLELFNHFYELNQQYSERTIIKVDYWLEEVLLFEE